MVRVHPSATRCPGPGRGGRDEPAQRSVLSLAVHPAGRLGERAPAGFPGPSTSTTAVATGLPGPGRRVVHGRAIDGLLVARIAASRTASVGVAGGRTVAGTQSNDQEGASGRRQERAPPVRPRRPAVQPGGHRLVTHVSGVVAGLIGARRLRCDIRGKAIHTSNKGPGFLPASHAERNPPWIDDFSDGIPTDGVGSPEGEAA